MGIEANLTAALDDLIAGARRSRLAIALGARDALTPYRVAAFGPLWITLQVALWVALLSFVFLPTLGGGDFSYVIYVSCGYVFFQLASSCLSDGVMAYKRHQGMLLNIPNPTFIVILQTFFKSLYLMAFGLPVVFGAYLLFSVNPSLTVFGFLAGLALYAVTLLGAALLFANLALVVPDLIFLTQAAMRILFFGTPIIWTVEQRGGLRRLIAEVNPLTHYIELVRAPFLGERPDLFSVALCAGLCVGVWIAAFVAFSAMRPRLAAHL